MGVEFERYRMHLERSFHLAKYPHVLSLFASPVVWSYDEVVLEYVDRGRVGP